MVSPVYGLEMAAARVVTPSRLDNDEIIAKVEPMPSNTTRAIWAHARCSPHAYRGFRELLQDLWHLDDALADRFLLPSAQAARGASRSRTCIRRHLRIA